MVSIGFYDLCLSPRVAKEINSFVLPLFVLLLLSLISLWLYNNRVLSGTTIAGQNWQRSDGNKGVLRIPSPSDCFMSYQESRWGSFTPLQGCSWCILQPQPTWPPDTCLESLTPLQRCSQCIRQPQPTGLSVDVILLRGIWWLAILFNGLFYINSFLYVYDFE